MSIDKGALVETLKLFALRVQARDIGRLRPALSSCLLQRPRIKCIIPDHEKPEDSGSKLMVLNEKVVDQDLNGLDETHKSIIKAEKLNVVPCEIHLGFDHFTTEEILKRLLPPSTDIISSFETVGHIAHLNLRDHLLPHKHLIAQVVLEKNRHIRTVVNKLHNIETQFREFPMEILAGDDDMIATVIEHKATYTFDYSKVYWNSRLSTEHTRLVALMDRDQVLCDVFAGVGPFAIPAGMRRCQVHANDLNPHSYQSLIQNAKKNNVSKHVTAYNKDGRDFIKEMVASLPVIHHFVMNLPATAVEFLDAFKGAYTGLQRAVMPMIHCYCFSRAEDPIADSIKAVESVLGYQFEEPPEVYNVRDVAPKKEMLCVSFVLPRAVAYGEAEGEKQPSQQEGDVPNKKRTASPDTSHEDSSSSKRLRPTTEEDSNK